MGASILLLFDSIVSCLLDCCETAAAAVAAAVGAECFGDRRPPEVGGAALDPRQVGGAGAGVPEGGEGDRGAVERGFVHLDRGRRGEGRGENRA